MNNNINKFSFHDNIYHLGLREPVGDTFTTCSTLTTSNNISLIIENFNYSAGGVLNVYFSGTEGGNQANASFNINSLGTRLIYYRNQPIPANLIQVGDLVTFVYDGNVFHIINIDRQIDPILDLYYNPGDVIYFGSFVYGGYLNTGRTSILWTIPLQKPISEAVHSYTVNDFTNMYVQGRGTTLISNQNLAGCGGSFTNTQNVEGSTKISSSGLSFTLTRNSSETWTNTTNLGRTPFCVTCSSMQVTLN